MTRLRYLREYLQSQGRLREARAILDLELAHTSDGLEQQKACESMLRACSNRPGSQEPMWWITGRTKTRLGQIATTGGQPEVGEEKFESARRSLQTAWASGKENNTLLLVRLAELDATSNLGHENLLNAYQEFVQLPAVQHDNYVHVTALTRASSAALAQLESDTSSQNRTTFWKWSTKTEPMLRKLGDIAYLSMFRPATGNIACSLFGDSGAILKWYEQFEIQYPSFHLWGPKTAAKRQMLLIYNHLKDEDHIFKTIAEMKSIADDQDDFWSENGFKKQEEISRLSSERKPDNDSVPAAFQPLDSAMEWLFEWSREVPVGFDTGWNKLGVNVGSDSVMPSTMLEAQLCSWIKQDVQAGILTERDLRDVLSLDLPERDDLATVTQTPDDYRVQKDTEEKTYGLILPTIGSHMSNTLSTFDGQINCLTPASVSLGLYGSHNSSTSDSRWEKTFLTLSDWLLRKSTRSASSRHFLLFNTQNQRLSFAIHSKLPYKTLGLEAQRLIDLLPMLSVTVQQQVSSNISTWLNIIAGAKHMIYIETHGHVLLDMDCPEFEEIIRLYDRCLAENRGNGRLIQELHTNMDIASVYFYAAARLDQKAMQGLFSAADRATEAFEKIREGWRALNGWDKVQKLLFAMEDGRLLQIAPMTVATISNIPDGQRELRDGIIWSMVQFAKSIGIGWLMESNAVNARRGRMNGRSDSECINNRPNSSKDNVEKSNTPGGNITTLSDSSDGSDRDLTTGDEQANAEDTIDPAGDQTGSGFSTDQVQAELHAINRHRADAVFVDWYNSAFTLAKSPRPVITTLAGSEEKPNCCLAKITWQEVDAIVNRFMDLETEELQDRKATKFLYKLNPLVEPLSWTKPGQTLVFSPCGNLHRIPLHALKIGGEIIIKRNPVVYCSSMSALVVAFQMRELMGRHISPAPTPHEPAADHPNPSTPSSKVSLFGDPPSEIGKSALSTTATRFKTTPHTNTSFTASAFTTTISDANLHLLHYHGHADFNPTSPMDHSLLFSDHALSLRDIFDIPPPMGQGGGFHATLLGCGSGMSKTVVTNDVLGLVPALLHAGASSVVSALWKFSDEDAAVYSDLFYGEFGDGKVKGVVDLARANQKAVLSIMHKSPTLYHWGAFVLNGCWLMKPPGQSKDSQKTENKLDPHAKVAFA